jgi:hypothetical protein
MTPMKDILPVIAILIVIISMSSVFVFILGEPARLVSNLPIVIILILWVVATFRVRRK